jgi:hypothetical protein
MRKSVGIKARGYHQNSKKIPIRWTKPAEKRKTQPEPKPKEVIKKAFQDERKKRARKVIVNMSLEPPTPRIIKNKQLKQDHRNQNTTAQAPNSPNTFLTLTYPTLLAPLTSAFSPAPTDAKSVPHPVWHIANAS